MQAEELQYRGVELQGKLIGLRSKVRVEDMELEVDAEVEQISPE